MSEQKYLDVLLKEEDRMAKEMFQAFVEKEMMPVRQQIDDDKEHKTVNKVLQDLTDMGIQKSAFPKEYGGGGMGDRSFPPPSCTKSLPGAIAV